MVKNTCKDNGEQRGRRFQIFGRKNPTKENPNPEIFVLRVFSKNEAFAKSKYWKILRLQKKIKKSQGELLRIQEVFDSKKICARNFGIYIKYKSQIGYHNMFKEYRDVNVAGAINQMYNELGGNYKVSQDRVEIIKVVELKEEQMKVRNPRCLQWTNLEKMAFPLWNKNSRKTEQKYECNFQIKRPVCYKTGESIDKQF